MPLSPRVGTGLVAIGAEVCLSSDAALAYQLAKGHGGWAAPMADCLGRSGTVVEIVNPQGDVRVNCGEYGSYVWNPSTIAGPAIQSSEKSVLALDLHPRRLFALSEASGLCGACRRNVGDDMAIDAGASREADAAATNMEVDADGTAVNVAQASAKTCEGPPLAYCSADGAFRLCPECAEPYLPDRDTDDGDQPLDCPGKHGLSDVRSHGSSRCDVCSQTIESGVLFRACRNCDWGICPDCLSTSPIGARVPRFDFGSCCRLDLRGKLSKAAVVDVRNARASAEVLLHQLGQPTSTDEWVEVSSERIIPVDAPAAQLHFHPAHRCGLSPARVPRGAEKAPKCAAEAKFPGGCRRYGALATSSFGIASPSSTWPVAKFGLCCERCDFFLCPWCVHDEVVEKAITADGVRENHHLDVAALKDPARCVDAAARISRHCSCSAVCAAGFLEAGLVDALADALSNPAVSDSPAPPIPVLALALELAEWLFNDPSPPQVGSQVLCVYEGKWCAAEVKEASAEGGAHASNSFAVELAHNDLRISRPLSSLRWAFGTAAVTCPTLLGSEARQLRKMRPTPRQGVPHPETLARDYLMKKAIPLDNTMQARQYLMDGADIAKCNENGETALVLAIQHGCTSKMIRMLLDFGCPLTPGEPLQLAARYGQIETVELLLDAGADPSNLRLDELPERAKNSITRLAAFLGIGAPQKDIASQVYIDLDVARAALAKRTLRPLVSLMAKPPSELLAMPGAEARLLGVVDMLLGMHCDDAAASCLQELIELLLRLMAAYSICAVRGAILVTRRLLAMGPWAHVELARCGIHEYVSQLVGNAGDRQGKSIPLDIGRFELVDMAKDLLREIEACNTVEMVLKPAEEKKRTQPEVVQMFHSHAAQALERLQARGAPDQHAADALTAALTYMLQPSSNTSGGCGATAWELEQWGIPQAIAALFETGALSATGLCRRLGPETTTTFASVLLRLAEMTEALPVAPLPPYLCQAPGLRVLLEPLVIMLANAQDDSDDNPSLQPYRPLGLHHRWMHVEPLLRVKELERAVLLTSPVMDRNFLAWCIGLVGKDVAPRDPNMRGGAANTGHVVDFRLATPLRIPVHTVRRMKDDSLVDLVSSVHGLLAVGDANPNSGDPALMLRVELLRLEAAFPQDDFEQVLRSLQNAIQNLSKVRTLPKGAEVPSDDQSVCTMAGVEYMLQTIGFKRAADKSDEWVPPAEGLALGKHFVDLCAKRDAGGFREVGSLIDPDPDIVAQLCAIFPLNGARRAAIAVNNSSAEAAMEWACMHQGDADFDEPLPQATSPGRGGLGVADPRAPVWSVFIVLPSGVPFELVWEMLEDPVKGALTSVANAWTAMGWSGGEAEMRETLRATVAETGEGPIARGLVRAKADRVASRLRNACECRVDADPEGAASVPRGRNPQAQTQPLEPGDRVHLVLEAEQLGFVAALNEGDVVDVVADDSRLLSGLPVDQVRLASRPAGCSTGERNRTTTLAAGLQALLQGTSPDAAGVSLASVTEPIGTPSPTPLQCVFEALDRGAQESDVVKRFQPQELLATPSDSMEQSATDVDLPPLQDAPVCRVAFALMDRKQADHGDLCLLRGDKSWITSADNLTFSSNSWLSIGLPGLAARIGCWYYEFELARFKNPQIGWADATFRFLVGAYSEDGVGDDAGSWATDCERSCRWHNGKAGNWRSAMAGQTIGCAIELLGTGEAQMWFAIDGVWDEEPAFQREFPDSYVYPAASGELDATFRVHAGTMKFLPPRPDFRPIGDVVENGMKTGFSEPLSLLPPSWTLTRGLYRSARQEFSDAPRPFLIKTKVWVQCGRVNEDQVEVLPNQAEMQVDAGNCTTTSLLLRQTELERGLPLHLPKEKCDAAMIASGIANTAARAALHILRELQNVVLCPREDRTATAVVKSTSSTAGPTPASGLKRASSGTGIGEPTASSVDDANLGMCSRRFGAKLACHLGFPLAGCSGAFPDWCSHLPIVAPWLFPLEVREALLRCVAFGPTFAIRWLQERAVDERFADRKRLAEERLAQAKHIGDAVQLNTAYESLCELQAQISRDSEAWVGSLKSVLARVERDNILQQAVATMELTRSSSCSLEVLFEGESGFGRAVTQGFYTLVAHELQRRTANREAPMWVEDDPPLNDDFLTPRRGLLVRPLPPDSPTLVDVEKRFRMLGRLMAKAVREGFAVPLPLTPAFFQLMLGGSVNPLVGLPRPGDGVAGEFVGACAEMVADAAHRSSQSLEELAADPEWSRKYMQPPGEEEVPVIPFSSYAEATQFLETGVSGAPLCPDAETRVVDATNVEEFVRLAIAFWLGAGVERQMVAYRKGLYDVLGSGAAMLWAFSPLELRRLFCGEDEVVWTEKELEEHIQCGGGYRTNSEQVRWLREDLLAMPQLSRAKFLEFVTSCPRLPPGGLRELRLSVHPDPADDIGLPRSRACAHRLFLPRYASREELSGQLQVAILSSGGHHEQNLPP